LIVSQLPGRAGAPWPCVLAVAWLAPGACNADPLAFGGTLAATSDYIYRGVSQSDGQGALQADLHAGTDGGAFVGIWASSRDRNLEPGTAAELQLYAGQRFTLGGGWSATVGGRADYFVDGAADHSDDYQELSAALTWLDRYTFSVSAIPSAPRYTTESSPYPGYPPGYSDRVYRSAAFSADASGQWLLRQRLLGGGLYAIAAAGYYYSTRPDRENAPGVGFLYGNAGLALAWPRWRIDLGYFGAERRAAQLFPYPVANRLAGTLSWQF